MTEIYTSAYTGEDIDAAVAAVNNADLKKDNNSATDAPTVSDDSSDGYEAGSQWIDKTTGILYVCSDATEGAAVWVTQGYSDVIRYGEAQDLTDDEKTQAQDNIGLSDAIADINSALEEKATTTALDSAVADIETNADDINTLSNKSMAELAYTAASGTSFTATKAAWTTLPLNALVSDPNDIVTFNTDDYSFSVSSPCSVFVGLHLKYTAAARLRVYDITNGEVIYTSVSFNCSTSGHATMFLRTLLEKNVTYRIEYYITQGNIAQAGSIDTEKYFFVSLQEI